MRFLVDALEKEKVRFEAARFEAMQHSGWRSA